MRLEFSKMQGCGNDFVVIDDRSGTLDLAPEAVEWLCDRHFGVGADGLILLRPARNEGSAAFMDFRNSDGSVAEMCGNGIRCVAKWLGDRDLAGSETMSIDTLVGVKEISVWRDEHGKVDVARVSMGEPIIDPKVIPADFEGEQVFDCPIQTDAGELRVTAVSMGNPHAVIWVDDVDATDVELLGPLVENHPKFPAKTNVEFAQPAGEDGFRVRVWERGVGETLACGTGACAVLVAAALSCRSGRTAAIELPGGELTVAWAPTGEVFLTGPAAESFTGTVVVPDE